MTFDNPLENQEPNYTWTTEVKQLLNNPEPVNPAYPLRSKEILPESLSEMVWQYIVHKKELTNRVDKSIQNDDGSIWAHVKIVVSTVPITFIEIDVESEPQNFLDELKNTIEQRIHDLNITRSVNINDLSLQTWFYRKEVLSEPRESRQGSNMSTYIISDGQYSPSEDEY
jgi:hypothetical protein